MACGEKSNEVLNEIYAADTSPNHIVRRIIEWHKGEIEVNSEPGHTEFCVRLPISGRE
jgi:light-regulated signal transduction histidine kinase (bacteriophytochrome)